MYAYMAYPNGPSSPQVLRTHLKGLLPFFWPRSCHETHITTWARFVLCGALFVLVEQVYFKPILNRGPVLPDRNGVHGSTAQHSGIRGYGF